MTEQLKKELIEQIKLGSIYDWLCNNYTQCTQWELVDIAKELAFELYSVCEKNLNDYQVKVSRRALAKEIEERIFTD